MALRSFVEWRTLVSIALFLGVALIAWGCASVASSLAPNSTAQGVKISVTPTSTSVAVSGTQKFTASVANTSNTAVIWQVNGVTGGEATHGTIDATGLFTAPPKVPSPSTVTIAAISQAQPTKMAVAQAAISTTAPAVVVSVAPASASVQPGHVQSLTATVQNDSQNKGVTWTLSSAGCSGTACGTLSATSSASGAAITYTPPLNVPSPASVMATAISVADPSKTAVAAISVASAASPAAITVAVSPAAVSVQTGHTQSITATVQNDTQNKGVNWTLTGAGCTGAACGHLSATSSPSGAAITYTAPANVPSPASVAATATSVADPSKTAVATITVTSATTPAAGIAVTVNPTAVSVQTGQTKSITATVQNDTQNKGVTWTLTGVGCSGTFCGTLSATSSASGAAITYTAPVRVRSLGVLSLTATSMADTSKAAVTAITVTSAGPAAAIAVTVNPTAASVQTGQTQSIAAALQNDTQNKGVSWALSGVGCSGAACGTLSTSSSASGAAITYTAPSTAPTPAAVTATATSVADGTKNASATITITAPSTGSVTVSVAPVRAALTTGQAQNFTATVAGSSVTTIRWEVDSVPGGNADIGKISVSGIYSAPRRPGTHIVAARSDADSTVSASASVAVTDLAGVFTYHNDLSRDGVNSQEYALNTSTVKAATFGKRFACGIDAAAYAQPLWVANVNIGGGTHNVLIAATQHDTVYAFDADASPCQTYWSKSLLGSGETWGTSGDVSTDDISPDIGIVGTPVIDSNTNTIYVVSKSKNGSTFHQRLHALNLSDGSEKSGGPQEIAFTSNGITFDPLRQNERAGLALVNGVVYVAYASHGDTPVYYGWVLGYNASNLSQISVFNDDSASGYGGIWMSGGAPAADSSSNLYVITGNGDFDGITQFGDSFLKLSTGSSMGVLSFFAPSDQASLSSADRDLGSGGTAILIDQPSGPVPHLLVGGGKEGKLYLLNRDNLGGNTGTDSGAVQTFVSGNAIFATPAFWQNTLYLGMAFDHVKAFSFNTTSGTFNTAPASQSASSFGFPGSTPSISSQGSSNGIVWAIEKAGAAILHAYDATNLGSELWNSASNGGDQAGQAVKFTVPTVANGKVYVGTATEISVYGLSPK
jgi:hypothetical protein